MDQVLEGRISSILDQDIELLCQSKAEEFHLLGYEHVTDKDIWECVSARYKKEAEEPALHRIVNDILSLRTTQFMNYATMAAYKGSPFS
ncbi:post-transcriptional regulator [Paenibacillus assamensis]|uniref:post-transcriptional regulator n=1 Tax=Paenibacillus assamensis TaxID=311244 RepID=UPI0003F7C69E|nr:post-transcriptional regulator [Paenibacillus assamensis]